jgi:hypothetical protein
MTPSQPINEAKPVRAGGGSSLAAARASSIICLLAGIWLFISPWVYGVSTHADAWNNWIVGGLIFLLAIIRIVRPLYSTVLGWCNLILGIWTLFSPWIYQYSPTNRARFINTVCVGVIVIIFSISSLLASRNRNVPAAERQHTGEAHAAGQSQ